MLKARSRDIVFVSCLLPPALWIIESLNRLLRRRNVFVVLHGEVEGFYNQKRQSFRHYGYWAVRWIVSRQSTSLLNLVVLHDFIRKRLLSDFPNQIKPERIFTIYHPVSYLAYQPVVKAKHPRVCFIGYRTTFKGYQDFVAMSRILQHIDFVAVGGGKLEHMSSGACRSLPGFGDYLREISKCAVAVFPYNGGYVASLSAAALDALSAGVHIVAIDRPFFVSLADYFGPDSVTIRSNMHEIRELLADSDWLASRHAMQPTRLNRLAVSPFGESGVQDCFWRLAAAEQGNFFPS